MLYIRVDGNDIIATGHVMRCLAIAEKMRKIGEDVTFILADECPKDIIENRGFRTISLDSDWQNMEAEIPKLRKVIEENKIEMLLIDSYYVTSKYVEELRKKIKVAYIDDFNDYSLNVDLLINYNIYASVLEYGNIKNLALGTEFVPLRQEFQNIVAKDVSKVSKILITSGGTDNYNITDKILSRVKQCEWFETFTYYVVIGKYNKNKDLLQNKWGNVSNIKLLCDISNMSKYMQMCDVAISAGGTTVYELCASGIPSILYTIADNQLSMARAFQERNLIPWAGDVRIDEEKCLDKIIFYLQQYAVDYERRKNTSEAMQAVVDGKGCQRIAEAILKL